MDRREFIKLGALFSAYALVHKQVEIVDYFLREFTYQSPASNQRMLIFFMKNDKGQNKIRVTKHLNPEARVGTTYWMADTFIPLEIVTLDQVNERKAYWWKKYDCVGWMTKYNWETIHKGNLKVITESHERAQKEYAEIAKLVDQGLESTEISAKQGVSKAKISSAYKVHKKTPVWVKKHKKMDQQILALHKQGLSMTEIAEKLDTGVANIMKKARRLGIVSPYWEEIKDRSNYIEEEILKAYHGEDRLTITQISEVTGIAWKSVQRILRRYNLPCHSIQLDKEFEQNILDLHSQGYDNSTIASMLHTTHPTVGHRLRKHGLRSNSKFCRDKYKSAEEVYVYHLNKREIPSESKS
jgi:hypothetical protein